MSSLKENEGITTEEMASMLDEKYLTFSLGKEEFGINIRFVTEIIGIHAITQMPDVANYIKGVINLRGKVHPVIDMRLRFGLSEREYDERTCIVVVNIDGTRVGLIVDTVSEVLDIAKQNIDPPPGIISSAAKDYIEGLGRIEDKVKILLNVKKVLYDIDIEKFELEEVLVP